MRLGTAIEQALKRVGVTEERVSRWIGRPCGCSVRRDRLDKISEWAAQVLSGRSNNPAEDLRRTMGEEGGS